MKKVLFITMIALAGCSTFHKTGSHGVFVRIVNVSPVETTSYKIDKYVFPGLKPGDTSAYQLMKKFNSGYEKCAFLTDKREVCSSIYDCGKCDVDTVRYLTVKIGISELDQRVPKIFYDIKE